MTEIELALATRDEVARLTLPIEVVEQSPDRLRQLMAGRDIACAPATAQQDLVFGAAARRHTASNQALDGCVEP